MKGFGFATLVLAGALVSSCEPAVRTLAAGDCSQPVIVAFTAAPSDELFLELERVSGARLEGRAGLTTAHYALTLSADGPQTQCAAAVERLRNDARVRSVDLDERRSPHSPGVTP